MHINTKSTNWTDEWTEISRHLFRRISRSLSLQPRHHGDTVMWGSGHEPVLAEASGKHWISKAHSQPA